MAPKRIAILGSTGSIGVTTLDVISRFPERFEITALAGGKRLERLAEQVLQFRPRVVAVGDANDVASFRAMVPGFDGRILGGSEGLHSVATEASSEMLISALVGAIGLGPTLAAIEAGKDIALANKEVLVVAGALVNAAARRRGVRLLPIDSEHNAIFQCLHGHRREDVRRIILTASGGPFLHHTPEQMRSVTLAQALKHPTWKMGSKITIDSSTLMNKGLEVIEAHWLFDLPPDRIDVVIHPQSIVHSMVEYVDGSVIAQMGIPDMAIPISYILGVPERLPLPHLPPLDLARAGKLEFFAPNLEQFPCLGLAYRALEAGGSVPAVLNGANEVLVQSFLDEQIEYLDIPRGVDAILGRHRNVESPNLESLLAADAWARDAARATVVGSGRGSGALRA